MTSKLGTRQVCASARTEAAGSVLGTEVRTRRSGDEVALAHRSQPRPVELVEFALVLRILAQHPIDRHRDEVARLPRSAQILDALGEIEHGIAQHPRPTARRNIDRQRPPMAGFSLTLAFWPADRPAPTSPGMLRASSAAQVAAGCVVGAPAA